MKKKKWLSFLLAFAIGISACTSAIAAFAAPADVAAVTKAIEALKDKTDVTTELTDQYKALTEEEKNSIEPALIHKLYYLRYQAATGRLPAQKITNVTTALGNFTDEMKTAIALSGAMQGNLAVPYTNNEGQAVTDQVLSSTPNFSDENYRLQYAAYKEMWANATEYQRKFADLQAFYTGSVTFIGNNARGTYSTSRYATLHLAEQQYLGKTPEEIQASFAGFPWSAYSAGYFDAVAQVANDYNAFLKGEMTSSVFLEKVAALDETKLPNADVIQFNIAPFAIYTEQDGQLIATPAYASTVYAAMRAEAAAMQPMLDFYTMIDGVKVPDAPSAAFNDTVAQVKVAGASLAKRTKYNMETVKADRPDVYQKYETIITMYYNTFVEKEGIADTHTTFTEETVQYEMGRPYGDIITKTLVPSVDKIVGQVLPSVAGGQNLTSVVNKLLFTNANVQPVAVLLAGITGETPAPAEIAGMMGAMTDKAEIAARLAQYSTWDDVPADFDWGVTPGDFESYFLAVLSAGGALPLFAGMLLPNTAEYSDSTGHMTSFTTGIYENVVIPLLEAFGAENIMSSETFTARCNAIDFNQVTTSAERYEPLMLVLRQVYGVYDRLLQNPVEYLSTILPNLVYHLEDGCIFDAVEALLDGLSDFLGDTSAIKQYLSLDGIFSALAPVLAGAGIQLNIEDIKQFARLGKATEAPSASMRYETTIYVVGNKDSVVRQLSKILEPIALNLLSGLGVNFQPAKAFVKVEAPAYPHNGKMGKDVVRAMIDGLDSLIGGFVNLNDVINGLFTPELAANAITGLYGLIGSLDLSSVGITLPTPKNVADMLTEAKYADMKEALNASRWSDIALVLKNDDTVVYQCDMGFKAGDRQGFIDCLTASLRPLVKMLTDGGLLVNSDTSYGLYETLIIPLFEALGVKPAADSATYTDNFNKLYKKSDKGAAYDYLVKTVLSPVLDLVDQMATSPVNTLMGLLPNLAYAVQYNEDLAFIGNLLNANGGLTGILNGLIQGIQTGVDADGNPVKGLAKFELPEFPLDALASCGKLDTELKSRSALHKTYAGVTADKADAFVTLFYYLYDVMNHKENMQTVKALLSGIEGLDPTLQGLIDNVLNEVFTKGREEALCTMGGLLASDLWECPDGDGNDGDSTPSTGDYAIPAGVFVVMMLSAGGAIVLLRRKKKTF